MIRPAIAADAAAIAGIYNHYIAHTVVTFEEDPVSGGEIAARIGETGEAGLPWLVAEEGGAVVGYAYASKWKGRCAYRYSVEVTVYLAPGSDGRGLGTSLYRELFDRLRQCGMHTAMGGISLPNPASVALHEKFGMEKVAHFREVGFKFDRWVDVGYWQGTL
mgnify:CR=1 FL=1